MKCTCKKPIPNPTIFISAFKNPKDKILDAHYDEKRLIIYLEDFHHWALGYPNAL